MNEHVGDKYKGRGLCIVPNVHRHCPLPMAEGILAGASSSAAGYKSELL